MKLLLTSISLLMLAGSVFASPATDLITRVVPNHARQFAVEAIPAVDGKDVFEIETRDEKVVLRGNNGEQEGRSILDRVAEQADQLRRDVGAADRDKLDQYFESVHDLDTRMVRLEDFARRPKPKPEGPPIKDPGPGEDTLRFGLMLDVARLAVQTDLTRIVTLYYVGTTKTPSQPGASFAYHDLSHHGQDAGKIEKLAVLERDLIAEWGTFLGRMKEAREGDGRLLDRTIAVMGGAMGNASSHDATNLPILVAGGRFRHGSHLAHDPKNPPPLCNLWVQMLHELGVEVPKFGTSTSETLSGFTT